MSRYQGFSEPIEVQIAILDELKKHTALLEKLLEKKEVVDNEHGNKPKNAVTRQSSNRRGGNSTK